MRTIDRAISRPAIGSDPARPGAPRPMVRAALLLALAISCLAAPRGLAQPPAPQGVQPSIPEGVWLLEGKAAVRIYDCEGLMCGRILWLSAPRDATGALDIDYKNPDPGLRRRPLCGLTIIGGVHPDGPGRWKGGWLYNPDDGAKYKITAQQQSDDVIVARAYLLIPLFGRTLTLARVPHGTSKGWC